MANVLHSTLTGADLHESKGAATATAGQVAIANGSGSAVFGTLSYTQLSNQPSLGDLSPLSIAPIANGGTGQTTASAARIALGAAASVGVTDASDAAAGVVGEYLTNTNSGTAIVTNTAVNATSLVLTAGDWDVDGVVAFVANGALITLVNGGINTVSATNPTFPNRFQYGVAFTATTQFIPTTMRRVSVSTTTTVYLIAQATFTGGTGSTVDGFLRARRVR